MLYLLLALERTTMAYATLRHARDSSYESNELSSAVDESMLRALDAFSSEWIRDVEELVVGSLHNSAPDESAGALTKHDYANGSEDTGSAAGIDNNQRTAPSHGNNAEIATQPVHYGSASNPDCAAAGPKDPIVCNSRSILASSDNGCSAHCGADHAYAMNANTNRRRRKRLRPSPTIIRRWCWDCRIRHWLEQKYRAESSDTAESD
ncbi:hypothetical protein PAPHI01_1655 [Pancytospora philotis]|nr:hypothetical protein PAPHI01_1655 [Pancytospora philotis]